jgi:hypothetical protein
LLSFDCRKFFVGLAVPENKIFFAALANIKDLMFYDSQAYYTTIRKLTLSISDCVDKVGGCGERSTVRSLKVIQIN